MGSICGATVSNQTSTKNEDETLASHQLSKQTGVIECNIPKQSQRAITSAYLLSHIVTDYFCCTKNKCEFMKEAHYSKVVESILDNILIQGGACRDILLSKPINDVDIQCNTRELTKIHLSHLKKYHDQKETQSNNHSCILFNHYLNKFTESTKLYDINTFNKYKTKYHQNNENKEEFNNDEKEDDVQDETEKFKTSSLYIRDCDYVLNAKFITNIIVNSDKFKNKVNLEKNNMAQFDMFIFYVRIISKFMYNNFNLDGQDIDISDIFNTMMTKTKQKKEIYLLHEKRREMIEQKNENELDEDLFFENHNFKSINMNNANLKQILNKLDNNLLDLNVPIYECSLENKFARTDLSINCVVLSLSAVKETFKQNNDGIIEITDDLYNELKKRIVCGGLYDHNRNVQDKSLVSTKQSVLEQSPQIHFWRVIKFAIRYKDDGWTISTNLTRYHMQLYKEWIGNKDYLRQDSSMDMICTEMFKMKHARNPDEYRKMIEIFGAIKFDTPFRNALDTNHIFRNKWCEALNQMDKDIINVFEQFHYPVKLFSFLD